MEDEMKERIKQVTARVEAACRRADRLPSDVNIIAVTKYVSLTTTGQAIRLGLRHIGENRWQDVQPKWEAYANEATWHFIGHLQTNKVKDVAGKFAYVHSLDRLSLARELEKKAAALGTTISCFIQLNVSGEQTKHGLAPEQLFDFARELRGLTHLRVVGLMTMAPYEAEPEETRPVFRGLREWRDRLNAEAIWSSPITELSMGMSNDFEVAIEEGATWVRLGTVLVGKEE